MPQMSPMSWMTLMLFFILMFLVMIILNYFFINNLYLQNSPLMKKQKTWMNWKW
uniref:ATP synthase complex subunit 8 n=1 Tax=Dianemobius furumagiensis TaxID=2153487 RepID=A0A6B9VWK0_9ORTH|nr:ATP synthase F0 subunit 8 [Dianemobius furumagiensis]QHQ73098.1 ATP synthase F0 subunit 8 [Dianemobius furumagiensis]